MIFGPYDAKLPAAKPRWRRIAVYAPVNVELEEANATGPRLRRYFVGEPDASLRVHLRHEPMPDDPNTIALYAANGRRIGSLHPEVAAWVAPLLDSGTSAFEGDIWPLRAAGSHRGQPVRSRTMTLIQHELSQSPCGRDPCMEER